MKYTKYLTAMMVFLMSFLVVPGVFAEPGSVPGAGQSEELASDGFGIALSREDLGSQTGKKDVNINKTLDLSTKINIDNINFLQNEVYTNGNLEGNSISLSDGSIMTNGANTISNNAFSNVNGIATIIQNSGNQCVIQTPTNLNMIVN